MGRSVLCFVFLLASFLPAFAGEPRVKVGGGIAIPSFEHTTTAGLTEHYDPPFAHRFFSDLPEFLYGDGWSMIGTAYDVPGGTSFWSFVLGSHTAAKTGAEFDLSRDAHATDTRERIPWSTSVMVRPGKFWIGAHRRESERRILSFQGDRSFYRLAGLRLVEQNPAYGYAIYQGYLTPLEDSADLQFAGWTETLALDVRHGLVTVHGVTASVGIGSAWTKAMSRETGTIAQSEYQGLFEGLIGGTVFAPETKDALGTDAVSVTRASAYRIRPYLLGSLEYGTKISVMLEGRYSLRDGPSLPSQEALGYPVPEEHRLQGFALEVRILYGF
jgi:hypothetical protein